MLTQNDIRQKVFSTKARGYAPSEVDDFLRKAGETISELQRVVEAKEAEIASKNARLSGVNELEATLRDTLVTAQRSANELMAATRSEAQSLLSSAQAQAAAIIAQADKDVQDAKKARDEIAEQIRAYTRIVRTVMTGQLDIMEEHFADFLGEGD